jgi:hypothetical protein
MADVDRGGTVIVVKPRYMSRGLCTCGWVAKPRLLLSSAKVEALIHAAQHDCEPAVPLIQPGVMMIMVRRGILDGDCHRAVRQSTSNHLLKLTEREFTEDSLQLIDADISGNAITLWQGLPVSRFGRYCMGYSPPRASSDGQGS